MSAVKVTDIAIIGMACRFPGASNYQQFWENLLLEKNCVNEIPSSRWDWKSYWGDPKVEANKTNSKWGGFIEAIDQFDPLFFNLSPKEASYIDPQHRLALETAWHSIEDAGYSASELSGRKVGVYIGVSKNDYAELMREKQHPIASYVSTGTVHSILANRISFFMNFRGKSEVVDTACSSSLVALQNAIRDIQSGECESAVVGGVNALLSPTMYISHGQSGMLSSEGKCKTFDKKADGYVRGEGVGFIFIKSLEHAIKDNDHIHGVIKGLAVNHGGRSNALTSPSVKGQSEVIQEALKKSGLTSDTITYVEAHGTGTPLGDPIEIKALTDAFRKTSGNGERLRCGIGSVKTNIGHLESASGMAGLMKVVLSLQHRQLPAQLHFSELNPFIELEESPFYIVDKRSEWNNITTENGQIPLRAGLSSFGMGGVNAHVVLEEAPRRQRKEPEIEKKVPYILPLSAKSESALEEYARSLIEFLQASETSAEIQDIACTLQQGRMEMDFRVAFLAESVTELTDLLKQFIDKKPSLGYVAGQVSDEEFSLENSEADMQSIAKRWVMGHKTNWLGETHTSGNKIPMVVYPFQKRRCWFEPITKVSSNTSEVRQNDPAHSEAYYSLKKSDYFLRDHIVQGESLLPGVASFEIARHLMFENFNEPIEAMRNIFWHKPLKVNNETSVSIIRNKNEFELKTNEGVFASGVVVTAISAQPFLSEELQKIKERCHHTISPQNLYHQFAQQGLQYGDTFRVIRSCYYNEHEALCEIALSESLPPSGSMKWEPSVLDGVFQTVVALQLMGEKQDSTQYVPFALDEIRFYKPIPTRCYAHAWLSEKQADSFHKAFHMRLFDESGALVASFNQFLKRPYITNGSPVKKEKNLYQYTTEWTEAPLAMHSENPHGILVFAASTPELVDFSAKFPAKSVFVVKPGELFERLSENSYTVRMEDEASFRDLFASLAAGNVLLDRVVYINDLDDPPEAFMLSLLFITRAMITYKLRKDVRMLFVSPEASADTPPYHAMVGGFARTLRYENPQVSLYAVEVQNNESISLSNLLASEICHYQDAPMQEIRYEGGTRKVRLVKSVKDTSNTINKNLFREQGYYLITGGMGGLGLVFARHLMKVYHATVILNGRSAPGKEHEQKLRSLESEGGKAIYIPADVRHLDEMKRLYGEIKDKNITLNGVIHAAGLIEDSYIIRKTATAFQNVIAPKVLGATYLDEVMAAEPLDFFMLTSSIAAIMPNQGQCDYAAANSFLDEFASYRNRLGRENKRQGKTIAINWPLWEQGGIQVAPEEKEHLWKVFGMKPMENDTGIFVLERSLVDDEKIPAHLIAIEGEKTKIDRHLAVKTPTNPFLGASMNNEKVVWELREMISGILSRKAPSGDDITFSDMGLDSLCLITLTEQINSSFHLNLKPSVFFEHQTIKQLATFLSSKTPQPAASQPDSASLIDIRDSDIGTLNFQKTLYNNEFFMRDHVVGGKYNVPGACYIEIGIQACQLATPDQVVYKLMNNYWARQLSSTGTPIKMEIGLKPRDEGFEYEISSMQEEGGVVHAMGQVYSCTPDELRNIDFGQIDIEAVLKRCAISRNSEELYPQIIAEGLHIGPAFMPMTRIHLNEEEALAHLKLPDIIGNTEPDYMLHPTLLTGVLQTALLNNKPYGPDGTQFIPIAIEEIQFIQAIPLECYVYSQRHPTNLSNKEIKKFDVKVLNLHGEVIAKMRGVSIRLISKSNYTDETNTMIAMKEQPKPEKQDRKLVENLLKEVMSEGIGLDPAEMNSQADFEVFGINSIMIIDLNRRMEERFGSLSKTLLFEYKNFKELAGYFIDNHASILNDLLPQQADDTPANEEKTESKTAARESHDMRPENREFEPQYSKQAMEKVPVHSGDERNISDCDIAIIGVAGRYPDADNMTAFWDLLKNKKDSVREIPKERFDYSEYYNEDKEKNLLYAKWGAFVKDVDKFDPLFFNISPREAELIDPQERLFLEVVWEMLEDAGYTRASVAAQSNKVGVFVGALWQPYINLGIEETLKGNIVGPSGLLYSIPNRVSYFFDWVGPSLAIDTACSSSLTALHYACESLRQQDCDSAVVGGVNLSLTLSKYLFLSQNGFLSTDGRCRSFGAGGNGYVPGEGIGAVYIKRLKDAVDHGDRIMGVIKATSVNHGGKTNGYTVPNPNQQSELIRRALDKSGVDPRNISYVEAHGTGTLLGDPIEIAGLTKAFAHYTQDKQYCAIGSVKSNIGHLEAAAGIAGLTKILLQFKHKALVPSIHTSQLNPNINFENTPFKVQTTLSDWHAALQNEQHEQAPYAMVSSFGAGGSYAHAILQDYQPNDHSPQEMPDHLSGQMQTVSSVIPLSAKSEEQAREYAQKLLDYLRNNEGDTGSSTFLRDFAYTLQTGREAMSYRLLWIVKDLEGLMQSLDDFLTHKSDPAGFYAGDLKEKEQFSNMIEADDIEDMAARWMERGEIKKLARLWTKGMELDWNQFYTSARPERLSLPTYPFKKERYWLPKGEGSKKNSTESGSEACQHLHPLVHRNIATIENQCYASSFTGKEFFLDGHKVNDEKILPGVAHLELVRFAAEAASEFDKVSLKNIIWIRPIKGVNFSKEIKVNLVPSKDHLQIEIYSEQERAKVIHSQGKVYQGNTSVRPAALDIATIQKRCSTTVDGKDFYDKLCGIGLGLGQKFQGITSLRYNDNEVLGMVKRPDHEPYRSGEFVLHPSLLDAVFQCTLLLEDLFSLKVPVELKELNIYAPIPEKAYAYAIRSSGNSSSATEVRRYDGYLMDESGNVCVALKGMVARAINNYTPPKPEKVLPDKSEEQLVMFGHPQWKEKALATVTGDSKLINKEETYVFLLGDGFNEDLREEVSRIENVGIDILDDEAVIDDKTMACFDKVFSLIKQSLNINPSGRRKILVFVHTEYSFITATLNGLFRTVRLEHAGIQGKVIQLDSSHDLNSHKLEQILQQEINEEVFGEIGVRYLATGKRVVNILVEQPLVPEGPSFELKPGGVYLITGGMGSLGKTFVRHLIGKEKNIKLVLSGRSQPHGEDQQFLRKMKNHCTEISWIQSDVGKRDDVDYLIKSIREKYGRLNGIIHAAGFIRDKFILNKTNTEASEVLAPKIKGTIYLDQATKEDSLDFFILFSSLAAIAGNVGQSDYASGNAFMDGYAAYRQALVEKGGRSGKTISINWPLWSAGGMQISEEYVKRLESKTGNVPMTTEAGLNAFDRLWQLNHSQVVVCNGNHDKIRDKLFDTEDIVITLKTSEMDNKTKNGVSEVQILADLKEKVSEVLKVRLEDVDINKALNDFGFESITFTMFSNELNKLYDLDLTPTLFFEYNTLTSLSAYLLTNYEEVLNKHYKPATDAMAEEGDSTVETRNVRNQKTYQFSEAVEENAFSTRAITVAQTDESVAIIGISGQLPGSADLNAFWKHLDKEHDLITEIPADRWDWKKFMDGDNGSGKIHARWGGFIGDIDKFDASFFKISPREAHLMDPQQRKLIETVWNCIEDAGYKPSELGGSDIGFFVGASTNDYWDMLKTSGVETEAHTATGNALSVLANRISYLFDFRGPSQPVDTACSSSLIAVHYAVQAIRGGQCEMAIAGGVNAILWPHLHVSFSKAGMLSVDGRCKSFDASANGYVRSEGVGTVLLKKLSQAERDGDHIYGVIKGTAQNHGGRANSLTAPNPNAQADLLKTVYNQYGIDPTTVGYIEAHGTGTSLGDPIEVNGLKKAFQQMYSDWGKPLPSIPHCGIGSVKSNIGHMEAAAGMAGIFKVLLAMKYKKLPATIHINNINPYINLKESPFYIVEKGQEWETISNEDGHVFPRRAGISSFGFGGANAHVILEEYIPLQKDVGISPAASGLIVLSARDKAGLRERILSLDSFIQENNLYSSGDLTRIAYTLQVGREAMEERVAFAVEDIRLLHEKFMQYIDGEALISGCYVRNANSNSISPEEDVQALTLREPSHEIVDGLATIWVNGTDVDWSLLYNDYTRPERISLPGYSFKKERFWGVPPDHTSPKIREAPANETASRDENESADESLNTKLTQKEIDYCKVLDRLKEGSICTEEAISLTF
ncbi:MAG: SDR family NAD(P)-dependent oxidoreductase [Cyclobacteriaceae bacterium]